MAELCRQTDGELRFRTPRYPSGAWTLLATGAGIVAVPLMFLATGRRDVVITIVCTCFGGISLAVGLSMLLGDGVLTIDLIDRTYHFRRRFAGPPADWEGGFQEFGSLVLVREMVQADDSESPTWVVYLVWNDPGRGRYPLARRTSGPEDARVLLGHYATLLGVPAYDVADSAGATP